MDQPISDGTGKWTCSCGAISYGPSRVNPGPCPSCLRAQPEDRAGVMRDLMAALGYDEDDKERSFADILAEVKKCRVLAHAHIDCPGKAPPPKFDRRELLCTVQDIGYDTLERMASGGSGLARELMEAWLAQCIKGVLVKEAK